MIITYETILADFFLGIVADSGANECPFRGQSNTGPLPACR